MWYPGWHLRTVKGHQAKTKEILIYGLYLIMMYLFLIKQIYHINLKLMYYLKMYGGEIVYLDGNKEFYH